MDEWQQQHRRACGDIQKLKQRFGLDDGVDAVAGRYPVRISEYVLEQIADGDDLWGRQFLPSAAELNDADAPCDPLAEERLSPLPGLVHRYRHRVLLLAAGSCFAYCRFCTRKRMVGCAQMAVSFGELMQALEYIAAHGEINEVIISGGDPLTLSNALLSELLQRLRRIPHVQIIRLGSRAPAVLPSRIDATLCALLARHQPLYFLTHFNHPAELAPAARQACAMLVDAGISVVNQTVLLRGVNDDSSVLGQLFHNLYCLRVRPYYLHQMDITRGTGHFRTTLEQGMEIMRQLQGELSGMAMPIYTVDLPGGHGKIPVTPQYVRRLGVDALLVNAAGIEVVYPQRNMET